MDTRTRLLKYLLLGSVVLLQCCYKTSDSESDNDDGTNEDDSEAEAVDYSIGDDASESGSNKETETVDTDTVDTDIVDTETVDTDTVDTDIVDTDIVDTETVDTNGPEKGEPSMNFLYEKENGTISIIFQPDDGFFYLPCNKTVTLYTFEGGFWAEITDLRYSAPHYVDGVFVDSGEKCNITACLDQVEESASTVNHIKIGKAAPPENSWLAASVDQIAAYETRETEPPWLVEVEYYTDNNCILPSISYRSWICRTNGDEFACKPHPSIRERPGGP